MKKTRLYPLGQGLPLPLGLLMLFAVLALWSVEVLAQDTTLARVLYEMNQDGYTGIRLSNQQSVNRVKHYYINELWTPQGWLYNVFNGTKESVLNHD
jgi:hypothetical protein